MNQLCLILCWLVQDLASTCPKASISACARDQQSHRARRAQSLSPPVPQLCRCLGDPNGCGGWDRGFTGTHNLRNFEKRKAQHVGHSVWKWWNLRTSGSGESRRRTFQPDNSDNSHVFKNINEHFAGGNGVPPTVPQTINFFGKPPMKKPHETFGSKKSTSNSSARPSHQPVWLEGHNVLTRWPVDKASQLPGEAFVRWDASAPLGPDSGHLQRLDSCSCKSLGPNKPS